MALVESLYIFSLSIGETLKFMSSLAPAKANFRDSAVK
jgi:hypothetical protein